MKKILFVLLFIGLLTGRVWATDYTADANVRGAWIMNTDESPVQDQSSQNKDLTLKGAGEPAYTASGKYGGGYSFDGSNDFFSHSISAPTTCSLVLWVYHNAVNATQVYYVWGTAGDDSHSKDWLRFQLNSSGVLYGLMGDGEAFNTHAAISTSTDTISATTWTHLAFTYDNTTGRVVKLYKNGTECSYSTQQAHSSTVNGYGYGVFIGKYNWNGGAVFNGTMDEGAVFNRVTSSTEINDIKDHGLKGDQGAGGGVIKTLNGLAWASVKTVNGLAVASVKTINGAAAQ